MNRLKQVLLIGVAVAAVGILASLVATPAEGHIAETGRASDVTLNLVAYSTPKDAYAKLIPAFQATTGHNGVSFNQSYGPSETQAQAVVNGLPADVVEFSLQLDMDTLVKAGLVAPTWNHNAYHGFVTRSVVVLIVRKGNPKHIHGWDDLVKPGIQVITPNPFTSGGARWNILAAYGAQLKEGKTPAQAVTYLHQLFRRVVVQDSSARNALNTFLGGKGDVLITYENEAIYARQHGFDGSWIVPPATIRIENPIAVLKNSPHRDLANTFVNFLYTPTAQKLFADAGYRPVLKSALAGHSFPVPKQLFDINFFGGWDRAQKKFFDRNTGIMAQIENSLGH